MRLFVIALIAIATTGCTIFHPYNWYDRASKEEQRACRKHCHGISSDLHAGTCWLACASLDDPWYMERRVGP